MGMLGDAALVMWWDIAPDDAAEFENWHSHEHMPERLRISGFLRGTRWKALCGSPSYFVMYETQSVDTLRSKPYLDRLDNPTPWSTMMFPRFRNMTRSECLVRGSFGDGVGSAALTVRLSPVRGQEDALRQWLTQALLPDLSAQAGLVGAHLLESQMPLLPRQTKEQDLRGGDSQADWVLLVEGRDPDAVQSLTATIFPEAVLARHGVASGRVAAAYELAFALGEVDCGRAS